MVWVLASLLFIAGNVIAYLLRTKTQATRIHAARLEFEKSMRLSEVTMYDNQMKIKDIIILGLEDHLKDTKAYVASLELANELNHQVIQDLRKIVSVHDEMCLPILGVEKLLSQR